MADNWIIPCNITVFDVISYLKNHNQIVWKNSFSIREGDTAYIYIGRPYGEIRYKCKIISDQVDEHLLKENSYAIPVKKSNNYYSKKEKYIVLELVCEYPEGTFTLNKLREHGLGQVQIQARTDRKLQAYLTEVEDELHNRDDDRCK